MSKKFLKPFALATALIMTLSLSACGSSAGTEVSTTDTAKVAETTAVASKSAPVSLKLLIHQSDDNLKKQIDAAMENVKKDLPDYQIDLDMTAGDAQTYETKVRTLMSSGDMPDVWWEHGGTWAIPILNSKSALPLNKYLESNKFWDMVVPSAKVASDDGNIYAVPFEDIFYGVIEYNTEIFAQNNLTPPKTVKDLENIVNVLKAKNITPIALAGKDGWPAAMFVEGFAYTLDSLATPSVVKGQKKFSETSYKAAATEVKKLIDMGAFTKNVSLTDYGTADSLFSSGKAAMIANGSWALAGNYKTMKGKCDYFYYPSLDDSKAGDVGKSISGGVKKESGIFVAASSKNPDAAVKLAISVAKNRNRYMYEEEGNASVVYKPDVLGWKSKNEIPAPVKKLAGDITSFKDVFGLIQDVMPTASSSKGIMDATSKFMTGQVTPDAYLKDMDAAAVAK